MIENNPVVRSAARAIDDNENTTPTEWWMFSGQTGADVANTLNTLKARIVDIKFDALSPYPLTVTYVQNSGVYGKQWWWYYDIDGPTLGQKLSDNKARLTSLKAYDIGGGQIRFAVSMISNTGIDGKAWWYYAGVTGAVRQLPAVPVHPWLVTDHQHRRPGGLRRRPRRH